ncbi:hypothetical protein NDU88_003345 [Pleurodeles waltl]|uniref:Uncharacterized protein n=1 Tax=Pleurodeles waltl TaxID=8319 RepID=A0AAV7REM2_PLEWA|nr:hypothetical protein NDU88_003345 [Pleurodeles waltl]
MASEAPLVECVSEFSAGARERRPPLRSSAPVSDPWLRLADCAWCGGPIPRHQRSASPATQDETPLLLSGARGRCPRTRPRWILGHCPSTELSGPRVMNPGGHAYQESDPAPCWVVQKAARRSCTPGSDLASGLVPSP